MDPMHVLHLGVWKDFCLSAIEMMLVEDVWLLGGDTPEICWSRGSQYLRTILPKWYDKKKKCLVPNEVLYEIQDLKPSMLGSLKTPFLAIKAAECSTFIEFIRDELREVSGRLAKGSAVLVLGEALVSFRDQMRYGPRTFSIHQQQRFCDTAARAFSVRLEAGVRFYPKWHMMLHIASDSKRIGNPKFWSTFLDESYNGRVASIAGKLHRSTWYDRLLGTFRSLYSSGSKRLRSA